MYVYMHAYGDNRLEPIIESLFCTLSIRFTISLLLLETTHYTIATIFVTTIQFRRTRFPEFINYSIEPYPL